MRASRTYGSVRGARHETRVPTATQRREFICRSRCRGARFADDPDRTGPPSARDCVASVPNRQDENKSY